MTLTEVIYIELSATLIYFQTAKESSHMTISPMNFVRSIDPTTAAHEMDGGWWYICGDAGQALGPQAGHLDAPEWPFPTESQAWSAAERFLRARTPLTAA